MKDAGSELRGAKRLIAACVAVLMVAGAGLLITARDVAYWIDARDGEIEARRVTAAVAHLASVYPGMSTDEVALRVARGFLLKDARIASEPAGEGQLSVPLGADGVVLVWAAPALGQEARANFAPTRLPFILGSTLVTLLLLYRLYHLAHALERERVAARGMARSDVLTGLGNRLAFDEDLARRLAGGGGFALACVDLNGFKSVNDAYGHAAGDTVLAGVAARLRRILTEQDAAYRLGGDEFAVLIADNGRSLARFAKKIVLNVDDSYTVGSDAQAVVGVCVGVAIAPQDGTSARELLQGADAALYRAKAASGSCARFAADEEELPADEPAAGAARAA
jgi:diguanylate cyclase (GGDEF)-like protein